MAKTIGEVAWEAFVPTGRQGWHRDLSELVPLHCNLVVVLDPDFTGYHPLSGLVRRGCHLFVTEKLKMSADERMKLIQLAEEGNTYIQVRNDLLFHPSLSDNGHQAPGSKLVEIHQVAPGKSGSLQEMLYSNLLMTLRIIHSEPSRISVCAIPHSGYQPDVVNLHLNFHNGSAASLTLSFTGEKKEHRLSVHASSRVTNYHFGENEHADHSARKGPVPHLPENLLLVQQIAYFAGCIAQKGCERFGLRDEATTFRLLEKINQKLEFSTVLM